MERLMTKLRLCGTTLAALMISSLPAFAVVGEDGQQVDCGSEICTTTDTSHMGDRSKGATVARPAPGEGGATVQNNGRGRGAMNPTSKAQDRRSSRARPAAVNAGGGDDIEGCSSC
jgi:hypothetical protein